MRCEIDGVINNKGEDQLLSIKALNEFDLRATDWRKKLESQRGAVLAFETKVGVGGGQHMRAIALVAAGTPLCMLDGTRHMFDGYNSHINTRRTVQAGVLFAWTLDCTIGYLLTTTYPCLVVRAEQLGQDCQVDHVRAAGWC